VIPICDIIPNIIPICDVIPIHDAFAAWRPRPVGRCSRKRRKTPNRWQNPGVTYAREPRWCLKGAKKRNRSLTELSAKHLGAATSRPGDAPAGLGRASAGCGEIRRSAGKERPRALGTPKKKPRRRAGISQRAFAEDEELGGDDSPSLAGQVSACSPGAGAKFPSPFPARPPQRQGFFPENPGYFVGTVLQLFVLVLVKMKN